MTLTSLSPPDPPQGTVFVSPRLGLRPRRRLIRGCTGGVINKEPEEEAGEQETPDQAAGDPEEAPIVQQAPPNRPVRNRTLPSPLKDYVLKRVQKGFGGE